MYFPTEEERKNLIKGLLPKSRKLDVNEELRGWNWHKPPLEPIYEVKLALHEVAGYYCPTGRDIYLKRVQGIVVRPNKAMVIGGLLHEALAYLLTRAKREIYLKGIGGCEEALEALRDPKISVIGDFIRDIDKSEINALTKQEFEGVRKKISLIWKHQTNALIFEAQELLTKQPYIGVDSLVSLAIPITVEQKLDGSFLGLSKYLSADAYRFYETMILDLKFGRPQSFHRLATTGYALVMEALYEYPINCGCIVYPEFKNERLIIQKDYHLIDDELRQWFIEARDEKMRMVYDEIDPGKPDECYDNCPYLEVCAD